MAKQLTALTLFVSGTSEVATETSALRTMVDDLNATLEMSHGITIRVIAWPDDFRPGVSSTPQAEINRQVGTIPDIYVGVLGTRFGTPTARAGSGTEEEFQNAIGRFQNDSTSIRVLIYFKRGCADLFAVDSNQFDKVKAFRTSIAAQGVLYRDYDSPTDFATMVRQHVIAVITNEWSGSNWQNISPSPHNASTTAPTVSPGTGASRQAPERPTAPPTEPPSLDEDDDTLGFLDYMDQFNGSASDLTAVLTRITQTSERMSGELDEIGGQITDLRDRAASNPETTSGSAYVARLRELVDSAANAIGRYADELQPELHSYRTARKSMFTGFRGALALEIAANTTSLRSPESVGSLNELVDSVQEQQRQTLVLQATISTVLPVTRKFKLAKRRAAEVVGAMIAEQSAFIEEARALLTQMST